MKIVVKRAGIFLTVLLGASLLLTSCATGSKTAQGAKFYEEAAASVIIRYSSDQAIFRVKPDGHEGAFYHIYTRNQFCETDAQRVGPRDLAVVVIGWQWTPELDRQIKQGWVDSLTKLNYRRVVVLRAESSERINGLQVLEDRQVAQAAVLPRETGFASAAPGQFTAR